MPSRIRILAVLAALALLLQAAVAAPALAQSLDALRASGAVGESYNGYLVARDSSAADAVARINAERREIYEKRATAQGVPADQVGRVYAGQILGKAPAGTWFLTPEGKWIQK